MSAFRTLALFLAPLILLSTHADAAQAQQSIAQLETEYDGIDIRLIAMDDFIQTARREGADLIALARAITVMEGLEGQLVILRQKLNALRAEEQLPEEPDAGQDEQIDDDGIDAQDEVPGTGDEINLTGGADGVDDAGDELWDALVADADANPGDYDYEAENTEVVTTEDEGDDWDSVDEIDGDVVGYVDENQINAMRDQMAQQSEYDKSRISADARQNFAQVQAEREARAIEAARKRAEFAAAMQNLANELNGVATAANQPTYTPPSSGSGYSTSSSSSGSSGGGMTNAQYQRLLKQCMDAKYAKARNSGFPIMDPNGPRIQCDGEIRRQMLGGSRPSASNGSVVRSSGGGSPPKVRGKPRGQNVSSEECACFNAGMSAKRQGESSFSWIKKIGCGERFDRKTSRVFGAYNHGYHLGHSAKPDVYLVCSKN